MYTYSLLIVPPIVPDRSAHRSELFRYCSDYRFIGAIIGANFTIIGATIGAIGAIIGVILWPYW